jgi:hypothetical protein
MTNSNRPANALSRSRPEANAARPLCPSTGLDANGRHHPTQGPSALLRRGQRGSSQFAG